MAEARGRAWEASNDGVFDWRQAQARIARLEAEHGRWRRRGLLALRLNIVLLVGIACWLALPNKALTAERVTAQQAGAIRFWHGESGLTRQLVRITGRPTQSWLLLGYLNPDIPRLSISAAPHGEIEASIVGRPSLRIFAGGSRASRLGPAIELKLGFDGAPQIVLRDAIGRVVWQAP
jgi:hypothetical protein